MAWFRVDDKFYAHPKVRRLGPGRAAAVGVWLLAGNWAADCLTDGFVPTEIVRQYDPKLRSAQRLVEVGLWAEGEHQGETGYWFHQWLDWQYSKAEVEERRRSRQEAGRLGGQRSGAARRSKTEPAASSNPEAPAEASASASASAGAAAQRKQTRTPIPIPIPTPSPPHPPATDVAGQEIALAALAERDRFVEFYAIYPRKKARADAEKAWKQVMARGADPDTVIAAARSVRVQVEQGRDPNYVPYPASWLRSGGYDDEPDPTPVARPVESRAAAWQALRTTPRGPTAHPGDVDGEVVTTLRSLR